MATFAVYNSATATLGGNLTLTGNFVEFGSSNLALAGHTLNITGNAQFFQSGGTPDVNGTVSLPRAVPPASPAAIARR